MRKTLALLVLGLLAISAPALAEAQVSGSLSVTASTGINETYFENADTSYTLSVSPAFSLSVGAEGDGWSVDASILSDTDVLNAGKIVATTPSFTLSAVKDSGGSYVLSKVADPFDFVVINNPDDMEDKGAVRLETSVLGPSLTLQFDDNTQVGVAASVDVAPATIGVVTTTALPSSPSAAAATSLAAYASADLGLATLTGGLGTDLSEDEDNFGFGVKAVVKPIDILEANASYVVKQANFGDRASIGAGAKANLAPVEASVDYSKVTDTADEPVSDSVKLSASYKVAPVEATVGFETGHPEGSTQDNPKTAITGSVSFALIPDVATLKGDFAVESDKDRDLAAFSETVKWVDVTVYPVNLIADDPSTPEDESASYVSSSTTYKTEAGKGFRSVDGVAKPIPADQWQFRSASHNKFGASVDYKLSAALTITPSFAYHSWNDIRYRQRVDDELDGDFDGAGDSTRVDWTPAADESITLFELGLSASYKVSDAVSLTASFKNQAYSFSDGLVAAAGL
ncbi:MAG: hypothetical protein GX496_06815, partial [Firmicutes bacterium]|nr:hypothetical protein [Bacillota bacterium]